MAIGRYSWLVVAVRSRRRQLGLWLPIELSYYKLKNRLKAKLKQREFLRLTSLCATTGAATSG